METTKFELYEKEYKCAHKDCSNTWTKMIEEEIPILMCGGHAKVCPTCKSRGFSVCMTVREMGDFIYLDMAKRYVITISKQLTV